MKKRLKNRIILFALCLAGVTVFGSCSDWTEIESLPIIDPNIETVNPELYAQYLAALVTYKQSDHKVVYVTFDNSNKIPGSRAEHINIVPDSVDIISLMSPDNLANIEREDIAKSRAKGTKIVYTISYEQIQAAFVPAPTPDPAPAQEGEGEPEMSEYDKYLSVQLDKALQLSDKYDYDGITIRYMGRSMQTMTDAQKAEYIASQKIVTDKVGQWAASHESKMLIFEGSTINLVDRSFLSKCKYIIIPTDDVKNTYGMNQRVLQSLVEDVPTDNIILSTVPFSLNSEDTDTGYFADGTSAMHSTAYWIITNDTKYTKAGLAIYGVQTDYFYRTSVYKYTRGAISIMNPSAKN